MTPTERFTQYTGTGEVSFSLVATLVAILFKIASIKDGLNLRVLLSSIGEDDWEKN